MSDSEPNQVYNIILNNMRCIYNISNMTPLFAVYTYRSYIHLGGLTLNKKYPYVDTRHPTISGVKIKVRTFVLLTVLINMGLI